jgi:hypothetical protein
MTIDKVTYKGVTFKGQRFGFTPGSWIITTQTANKIAKLCGVTLPKIGYDKALNGNDFQEFITNSAGLYRISLKNYEYKCIN